MRTLDPPMTRGTVILQCDETSCRAKLEADVSEGEFREGTNDGPYVGESFYEFRCPYCKSYLHAHASRVQWSRDLRPLEQPK